MLVRESRADKLTEISTEEVQAQQLSRLLPQEAGHLTHLRNEAFARSSPDLPQWSVTPSLALGRRACVRARRRWRRITNCSPKLFDMAASHQPHRIARHDAARRDEPALLRAGGSHAGQSRPRASDGCLHQSRDGPAPAPRRWRATSAPTAFGPSRSKPSNSFSIPGSAINIRGARGLGKRRHSRSCIAG